MIKIENGFIETDRANTHLRNITHLSWEHYKAEYYNVELHFSNDLIIQRVTEDELKSIKVAYQNEMSSAEYRPQASEEVVILSDAFDDMLTIEGGFISYGKKWVADLQKVEFISYKENHYDKTPFVKLHLGGKEARINLKNWNELEKLKNIWKENNR